MYKQLNITWFVAASLLLHAIFFTQYKGQSVTTFKNSPDSLNVVISRKIIQLHFSNDTKANNAKYTNNSEAENKPKIKKNVTHEREEIIKKSIDNSQFNTISKDTLDVKNHQQNHIIQSERQIQQQAHEKNLYVEEVLLKIERNKFYPALARRRNMQDIVKVSFSLLESGEITNIEMNGHYKILRYAAKSALLNALPFNTPPSEMQFPFTVKYSMAFKLEK